MSAICNQVLIFKRNCLIPKLISNAYDLTLSSGKPPEISPNLYSNLYNFNKSLVGEDT